MGYWCVSVGSPLVINVPLRGWEVDSGEAVSVWAQRVSGNSPSFLLSSFAVNLELLREIKSIG